MMQKIQHARDRNIAYYYKDTATGNSNNNERRQNHGEMRGEMWQICIRWQP